MKNTSPSVASSRTIIAGPLKMAWPNAVRPVMAPVSLVTTAAWKVK